MWWALAAPPKHVVGGFAGGRGGLLGRQAGEGSHTREPLNFGAHLGLVSSKTSSSGRHADRLATNKNFLFAHRALGVGVVTSLSLPPLPEPRALFASFSVAPPGEDVPQHPSVFPAPPPLPHARGLGPKGIRRPPRNPRVA